MNEYNFNLSDLELRKHMENERAVRILRRLGFYVVTNRIGGEGEHGGRIAYFTASSIPLESADSIKAMR